ncbi:ABC transporter permease [Desertimonas flava]|uniref:ABC transporter permease n=1 Tax=Desertimonas flava TaxID=2064846 RepID=UPI000E34C42B|nr:ABC transporter permease [Desertimonas flava]
MDTMDVAGASSYESSNLAVRARRAGSLMVRLLFNPTAAAGVVVIALILGMAILAPLLVAPNTPDAYQMPRDWGLVNAPPGTSGHLLGTTSTGADVLYGVVWGARMSVRLSLIVVGLSVAIGVVVGSLAGVLGGKVDELVMRLVDIFMAVPELLFPLAIAAALGPSLTNITIALACVLWTKYARIVRAEILRVRESTYVEAATALGDTRFSIFRRDILPNSLTPLTVQSTLDMGRVVLMGATLSFIGLAEAGLAEWGTLVSQGRDGIAAGHWWTATFPGLLIFLWALAFNLVGDGLRDVLDPRTQD